MTSFDGGVEYKFKSGVMVIQCPRCEQTFVTKKTEGTDKLPPHKDGSFSSCLGSPDTNQEVPVEDSDDTIPPF